MNETDEVQIPNLQSSQLSTSNACRNEFVNVRRGEYLGNGDESDELRFHYVPYIKENTLEPHQTYDEFVVPIDELTDDEDDELMSARDNVKNYRNRLKGIRIEKIVGGVVVETLGDSSTEPISEAVIDENVEYNEMDDIGGLASSSEESNRSVYYSSSDYGSYYSESDDEYKDDALRDKRETIKFDSNAQLPVFCLGMVFQSADQFRLAVTKYGVIKGLDVRMSTNEPYRLRAVCKGDKDCKWHLYASDPGEIGHLSVKTYIHHHHCRRLNKIQRANSKFIALQYKNFIMIYPGIKLSDLVKLAKTDLKINVSISACRNAKRRVLRDLIGDYTIQYARLYDYVGEIRKSNPGTTCLVSSRILSDGGEPTFFRFYVCFEALKKGWKAGCRPILGFDGCFLKGICKGQLLCAVGRDGNNQMFPIAWAICEVENTSNWSWFITRLKDDLELKEGAGITVMSDMQKGLIAAVREVIPQAWHRMCARHIYASWSKTFRGDERKVAFWAIAKSTYKNKLTENVKKLQLLGEGIFEALTAYPLHTWCKNFFTKDAMCDVVDNNMCETFNGWIMEARSLPIISMLDAIRQQVMKRNVLKRRFVDNWKGNISPKAMEKLGKNEILSHDWMIDWNGDEAYEVTYMFNFAKRHTVNLANRECSCRGWDITGIPCHHAIACIQAAKREVTDYVSDWYSKETYLKAYGFSFKPVKGIDMLDDMGLGGCLPPPFKVMPGRPKRNRRKDPTEERKKKTGKMPRLGLTMKCSLCKAPGHNFQTCPKKKDNPEYIPPSRQRKAKNKATTSSQPLTDATRAPPPVQQTPMARFRTSNEANLQSSIGEAMKFASEMSAPRSRSRKEIQKLTLTQLEMLKKTKSRGFSSSSQR